MKLRPEFPGMMPRIGNVCLVCNLSKKPTDEGVLDCETHIDLEGWVYLCQNCVIEAAHLFDLMTKKQGDSIRDQNRRLSAKVTDLEIRAAVAEDLVDAIRRYNAMAAEPIDVPEFMQTEA